MKILKRAGQKNFRINKKWYIQEELVDMLKERIIDNPFENTTFVVYADDCKEVKVILTEYGNYETVAVLKDGTQLFIEL